MSISLQDRNALIRQWQQANANLDAAKKAESDLRDRVMTEIYNYNPDDLKKGTENIELGGGYQAKAVFNTKLKANETQANGLCDELEKTGNEGTFIADRLVKWKPEISVSEYNKLSPQMKKIADKYITQSASKPSFSVELKKG